MTLMATAQPPAICPECGFHLEADGWPIGHRTDEGNDCGFDWREWLKNYDAWLNR